VLLLLILLTGGPQSPAERGPKDPSFYSTVAAEYRRGRREAALAEIRRWRRRDIFAAVQALRDQGDLRRMLAVTGADVIWAPVEIDFATVEAAALMHVEASLMDLQALGRTEAEMQFSAASKLVEWLYALRESRPQLLPRWRTLLVTKNEGGVRESAEPDPPPGEVKRALTVELTIGRREFYVALAASTLALGFPETALQYSEKARAVAAGDADALFITACAKQSLALHEKVRAREGEARRLREEAEALLRETLTSDPGRVEAQVRLGSVLLAQNRAHDAESVLQQAAEHAREDRERYLAFLFLARAAELQDRANDTVAFYRRATETWPSSQAARLGLARSVETSGRPAAARTLVLAGLAEATQQVREPDPWFSFPFGPRAFAKATMERVWKRTLGHERWRCGDGSARRAQGIRVRSARGAPGRWRTRRAGL
jgi:tetratricopeptide (TPR) repeat protein